MRAELCMLVLAISLALVQGAPGAPASVPRVRADPPLAPTFDAQAQSLEPRTQPFDSATQPFDARRRFSPSATVLPMHAPERLIIEKLELREYQWAADLARSRLAQGTVEAGPRSTTADATDDQQARLRWLLAQALEHLERPLEAENVLIELVASGHPLARWSQLRLGALQLKHAPAEALATLSPLLEDFPDAGRARQLHAIALTRCARGPEAVPQMREMVARAPAHLGAARVAMPLAELLEKRNQPGDRLEALALYRRVTSRAPQTAVGRMAGARARRLLKMLPKRLQRKHARPAVEDSFARGTALLKGRAYDQAVKQFELLSKRVRGNRRLRCQAQLEMGRALLRKRQRKEGAALMAKLARTCRDKDVRAWAHYYAGRALFRLDKSSAALRHYDALPRVAPKHRLADDGLFQGALAAADLDDEAGMSRRLRKLVNHHPDGDMRPDGLFLLAWHAYKAGRYEEASGHFERLLEEGPGEEAEGIQGRAAYWRARSLGHLKRTGEAVEAYVALVKERPLNYHARQALARLDELAPARANKLRNTLLRREAPSDKRLTFAHRHEMDDPEFSAAVNLLQLGERERAHRAFEYLGASGSQADPEFLWLVAALYDTIGAYAQASGLARSRLSAFMQTAPQGRAYKLWRIAFPNAFAPLIEEAAEEANVPAAFVRAVAREESAFNPEAVSHAHAYGLIQLMRPTAREHAASLGLPSDPASLKRPEINLRIGARFIRFLWSRYRDNPAVVPAAYNAGHGAAERWMRASPDKPLDEWVESIPYDETRRYTRRVLQTYGVYAWLDGGKLPPLRKRLPRR